MLSTVHNLTPAKRIKKPSYSTVATWVKESWDEVNENIIWNSFRCCGILTKTDGLEDNCLFDYDTLLDPVNDDDEVENLNDLSNNDKKVYFEENDYENEWNIENDNGNEINEKECEEESEAGNKDEYQGSTNKEEHCILKNLRVHYKGY